MPDPRRAGVPDDGPPTSGDPNGPHTIDLTSAWEPPAAAPGGGSAAAWTRSFGLPTGLSPGDRVWLVLDGDRDCRLMLNPILNESPLPAVVGSSSPYAIDVTALLLPRNRLRLLPAAGEPPLPAAPSESLPAHGRCRLPAAYGRVRLEIDSAAVGSPPQETPAGA